MRGTSRCYSSPKTHSISLDSFKDRAEVARLDDGAVRAPGLGVVGQVLVYPGPSILAECMKSVLCAVGMLSLRRYDDADQGPNHEAYKKEDHRLPHVVTPPLDLCGSGRCRDARDCG